MYPELSVDEFLARLASAAAEPGGGAAAALVGAAAAALVSMVANLTIGKVQYREVQVEMEQMRERADALRAELLAAVDRDAEAFRRVMSAYGLPRATDDEKAARRRATQQALREASVEPADVVRLCRDVAIWSNVATAKGNVQAISDSAVAALLADAAAQSAALNVKINVKSIGDPAFGEPLWARVQADLDAIRALRGQVMALAGKKLA
ncbi:MAG: cyclodeaminase/cyclohydrolase family protein [Armatimonadota bacterium]